MPLSVFEHRTKVADAALAAAGWTDDLIRCEETPGRITFDQGRAQRGLAGVQFVLRVRAGAGAHPVAAALLELKAGHLPPDHGLDAPALARACRRLHVPVALATNGHQWVTYDAANGLDRLPRPMADFPRPAQLREQFERATGVSLGSADAAALRALAGGEGTRRTHEDAAARAILMRIARGETRALGVLAAGTRPTAVARLVLRRLVDAGLLARGLVLTDRFRAARYREILGDDPRLEVRTPDEPVPLDRSPTHLFVDECVSAHWPVWQELFTKARAAVHIGLTDAPLHEAIPEGDRFSATAAEVLAHFGPPAYAYGFTDAAHDGWVGALELVRRDFGAGSNLAPVDDAFQQLSLAGGPDQTTVVVTNTPEEVAAVLEARYAAWCEKTQTKPVTPYTGPEGAIAVVAPEQAVRHALPHVRSIVVLDEVPPLQLQRVVSRAAATDIISGKALLRVLDYSSATRHLAEPIRAMFPPARAPVPAAALPPLTQSVTLDGAEIRSTLTGRYAALRVGGEEKLVPADEMGDALALAVVKAMRDLDGLRQAWTSPGGRRSLLRALPDDGRSAGHYRALGSREDAELYDVLAELGWGMRARSREGRAESFAWRHAPWLSRMPTEALNVIKALLRQFVMHGTGQLDDIDVLSQPDLEVAGGMRALRKGGAPADIIREIRERLFTA